MHLSRNPIFNKNPHSYIREWWRASPEGTVFCTCCNKTALKRAPLCGDVHHRFRKAGGYFVTVPEKLRQQRTAVCPRAEKNLLFLNLFLSDTVPFFLPVFLFRRPSRRATASGVLPQGILGRLTMRITSPTTAPLVCR